MRHKDRTALESCLGKLQRKYNKDIVEYFPDDIYRPWFEYLRTARESHDPGIQSRLARSKRYYAPWSDITRTTFDEWIGGMDRFFAEQEVRLLRHGQPPVYKKSVVIEVPLNKPEYLLLRDIRTVFKMEHIRRQLAGAPEAHRSPRSKYKPSTYSRHKPNDLLKILGVYRVVTAVRIEDPALRGRSLLDAVYSHYRENERTLPREIKITKADEETEGLPAHHRALRQLNRYIAVAKNILRNTAEGTFPGKH